MTELEGRTFLVTGATSGLGLETVRDLAGRGATVYMTARSETKGRPVLEQLSSETGNDAIKLLTLDLGDLDSVRACADAFLETGAPLHCLINNAGLAGSRGMTDSGFEITFGTNHVGPFLFTSLLLDRIKQSAPARIVNVASEGHYRVDGIDWEAVRKPTKTRTAFPEYCVSKLGNVLHAQELGRRLDGTGVTAYSLHPGAIATDIWRKVPWPIRPLLTWRMRSPAEGAQTTLHCATSADAAGETGLYYEESKVKEPNAAATPELGRELWERSAEWVGVPV